MSLYSATKVYDNVFTSQLLKHVSLFDKLFARQIDTLVVTPSVTKTAMTNYSTWPFAVTPDKTAEGSLLDLGKFSQSAGAVSHSLEYNLVQLYPRLLLD